MLSSNMPPPPPPPSCGIDGTGRTTRLLYGEVVGEISMLLTIMRQNARWMTATTSLPRTPSRGRSSVSVTASLDFSKDSILIQNLRHARDLLLSFQQTVFPPYLDYTDWISPFLSIIKVPETSGVITGAALSTIAKFLDNNFISVDIQLEEYNSSHCRGNQNLIGSGSSILSTAFLSRLPGASSPLEPFIVKPSLLLSSISNKNLNRVSVVSQLMNEIVEAVVMCKFEPVDLGADSVVLIRILSVLKACIHCGGFNDDYAPGKLLSARSIFSIVDTCVNLSRSARISTQVRDYSETVLTGIIQFLFKRVRHGHFFSINRNDGFYERSNSLDSVVREARPSDWWRSDSRNDGGLNDQDVWQPAGKPYDIRCIRRLFAFLASVANPIRRNIIRADMDAVATPTNPSVNKSSNINKEQTGPSSEEFSHISSPFSGPLNVYRYAHIGGLASCETLGAKGNHGTSAGGTNSTVNSNVDDDEPDRRQNDVYLALNLIIISLDASDNVILLDKELFNCISDDICRLILLNSCNHSLIVLSLVLRIMFWLYIHARSRLKKQIQWFVTDILLYIGSSKTSSYDQKEMIFEKLIDFCQFPGFLIELYYNYDCDTPEVGSLPLFEMVYKFLCLNSYPTIGVFTRIHHLAFKALLVAVDVFSMHCYQLSQFVNSNSSNMLDQNNISSNNAYSDKKKNRLKRLKLKSASEMFNRCSSNKLRKVLLEIGQLEDGTLLTDPTDPVSVVTFLRSTPGLNKTLIGNFLGERGDTPEEILFYSAVLSTFISSFNFENVPFVCSLRLLLESFRLPGEAQKIDRVVERFANHYCSQNPNVFATPDVAYTLSFSIVMLNTDLYNVGVRRKMTLDDFIRNNRGINGDNDLPVEMLRNTYLSICAYEIRMSEETNVGDLSPTIWNQYVTLAGAYFIHDVRNSVDNSMVERDMFELVWGPTLAALSVVFSGSDDRFVLSDTVIGLVNGGFISQCLSLNFILDQLINSVYGFYNSQSDESNPDMNYKVDAIKFGRDRKALLALRTLFSIVHASGSGIGPHGWTSIVKCVSKLLYMKLLSPDLMHFKEFSDKFGRSLVSLPDKKTDTSGLASPSSSSFLSSLSLWNWNNNNEPNSLAEPSDEEKKAIRHAERCVMECRISQIFESDILHWSSDSVIHLVDSFLEMSSSSSSSPQTVCFFLERCVAIMELPWKNEKIAVTLFKNISQHLIINVLLQSGAIMRWRSVALLRLYVASVQRGEDATPCSNVNSAKTEILSKNDCDDDDIDTSGILPSQQSLSSFWRSDDYWSPLSILSQLTPNNLDELFLRQLSFGICELIRNNSNNSTRKNNYNTEAFWKNILNLLSFLAPLNYNLFKDLDCPFDHMVYKTLICFAVKGNSQSIDYLVDKFLCSSEYLLPLITQLGELIYDSKIQLIRDAALSGLRKVLLCSPLLNVIATSQCFIDVLFPLLLKAINVDERLLINLSSLIWSKTFLQYLSIITLDASVFSTIWEAMLTNIITVYNKRNGTSPILIEETRETIKNILYVVIIVHPLPIDLTNSMLNTIFPGLVQEVIGGTSHDNDDNNIVVVSIVGGDSTETIVDEVVDIRSDSAIESISVVQNDLNIEGASETEK